MKTLIKITLTILVLACPTSAAASSFGPQQEQELAEAQAYWGIESQCTSLTSEMVAPGSLGENLGEATQPSSPVPCNIELIEGQRPCVEKAIVIHEVGHLDGLGHSEDEESFMYSGSPMMVYVFCSMEVLSRERRHVDAAIRKNNARCPSLAAQKSRMNCRRRTKSLQGEVAWMVGSERHMRTVIAERRR